MCFPTITGLRGSVGREGFVALLFGAFRKQPEPRGDHEGFTTLPSELRHKRLPLMVLLAAAHGPIEITLVTGWFKLCLQDYAGACDGGSLLGSVVHPRVQ